jgi:hypothetical protein
MTSDQLRQALGELHGDRDVTFAFARVHDVPGYGVNGHLHIKNAMLIPNEADGLVKLTDGKRVYIITAENIAWISIG